MSADLIFLMLAAPAALAFLVIMPFDIISALRGDGSIFDPPAVVLMRSNITMTEAVVEIVRRRSIAQACP